MGVLVEDPIRILSCAIYFLIVKKTTLDFALFLSLKSDLITITYLIWDLPTIYLITRRTPETLADAFLTVKYLFGVSKPSIFRLRRHNLPNLGFPITYLIFSGSAGKMLDWDANQDFNFIRPNIKQQKVGIS